MSKRHTTPVVHRHGSSNASPETEATRLRHELHEALEQQAATAGVLKLIISSSFGDPQQVFANILASAVRICGADGGALHLVATHNMPQTFIELSLASQSEVASKIVLEPGRGSVLGRVAIEAKPVQVTDVLADPEYTLHEATMLAEGRICPIKVLRPWQGAAFGPLPGLSISIPDSLTLSTHLGPFSFVYIE
jgi:hypothetical protein